MKSHKYNKSFEAMKNNLEDFSCGMMPAPMEAQTAVDILCDYLLGDDWYIATAMNQKQANACIVEQILDKYSKQWQKDRKNYEKENSF
jgi:hypothetical protein